MYLLSDNECYRDAFDKVKKIIISLVIKKF